jgi:cytosine/adenosine deaminase-related metal-dependent hydrolase
VILPALVNAHTHLSLSGLAGKVPWGKGFLAWIQDLMSARQVLRGGEAGDAAESAALRLKAGGVGLVGEFGPHFPVADAMGRADLWGTVWLEFFGNRKSLPPLVQPVGGVRFAYAGHAPNTVSPALLRYLKERDSELGLPYCLHLAESVEETEFLATGKGPWADFLERSGMRFSHWDCWGRRPVELAGELGLLDQGTLAVHLLQAHSEDMTVLSRSGVNVCLCPRSNLNLHGMLPDIQGFLAAGVEPALGTDSLASVESLSIWDEMRFVAQRYQAIRPDMVLAMGTANGARALGRGDLGRIEPGATARLIYVEMEARTAAEAAERLVHLPPVRVEWL